MSLFDHLTKTDFTFGEVFGKLFVDSTQRATALTCNKMPDRGSVGLGE